MHINGIDPGFANDVLPLVMTSLSQRIDEVRVMEICDYSTYYQPVVMNDIFGFGKPMDEVGMIFHPGILTMAWGSVVRQIAAGLDLTLDEPLTEEVDRRAAEWDTDNVVRGDVEEGDDGRGEVRGRRQGRRRPAGRARAHHPHRPRAGPRVGEAAGGLGRLLPDQDHRRADDERRLHPPRRARRPQRLGDDHHRAAHHQRAAGRGRGRPGHRPRDRPAARDRPRAGESK